VRVQACIYITGESFAAPFVGFCLQKLAKLQAEIAEQTALLEVAQGDLNRDELIFADKAKEVARLQAELESAAERAQRREQAMAARLQHMQADLRRCVCTEPAEITCLQAICAQSITSYTKWAECHLENGIASCTGYHWRLDLFRLPPMYFSLSLLRYRCSTGHKTRRHATNSLC